MNNITPSGNLSPTEAKKSSRDAILFSIWALIWELISILQITDFWDNQIYVSMLIWAVIPFLNRKYNWIRIPWKSL